jgi:hypothetical protein
LQVSSAVEGSVSVSSAGRARSSIDPCVLHTGGDSFSNPLALRELEGRLFIDGKPFDDEAVAAR